MVGHIVITCVNVSLMFLCDYETLISRRGRVVSARSVDVSCFDSAGRLSPQPSTHCPSRALVVPLDSPGLPVLNCNLLGSIYRQYYARAACNLMSPHPSTGCGDCTKLGYLKMFKKIVVMP